MSGSRAYWGYVCLASGIAAMAMDPWGASHWSHYLQGAIGGWLISSGASLLSRRAAPGGPSDG